MNPKSWTVVTRQSRFEFSIGQGLTHSIFLWFCCGCSNQGKQSVPTKTRRMTGMSAGKAILTLTGQRSFPYPIVQEVPLPGHTLSNTFFRQSFLILGVLILPALIGMKDQVVSHREPEESLFQYFLHLAAMGSLNNKITDDLIIVRVKNRREIKVAPKQGNSAMSVPHF